MFKKCDVDNLSLKQDNLSPKLDNFSLKLGLGFGFLIPKTNMKILRHSQILKNAKKSNQIEF